MLPRRGSFKSFKCYTSSRRYHCNNALEPQIRPQYVYFRKASNLSFLFVVLAIQTTIRTWCVNRNENLSLPKSFQPWKSHFIICTESSFYHNCPVMCCSGKLTIERKNLWKNWPHVGTSFTQKKWTLLEKTEAFICADSIHLLKKGKKYWRDWRFSLFWLVTRSYCLPDLKKGKKGIVYWWVVSIWI